MGDYIRRSPGDHRERRTDWPASDRRERRPFPDPRVSFSKRSCDGWPEIGSCSAFAMRNCDYCKDCEALRRAHEGIEPFEEDTDETDTEDEVDTDD